MADEETSPAPSPAEEPATPSAADVASSGEPKQEATPAPTEPEAVASEPVVEVLQSQTQTAQIPVNEPIGSASASVDEPLPPEPAPAQSATSPATNNASPTDSRQYASDRLVKARASIQDRKRNKIDKIMEALKEKDRITNDEVEKLLHVSDATATRYLSDLEKEGKIKQVGKTGIAVVYTKI